MKKIPIGIDDFKKIRENNYYYIDNTKIEACTNKYSFVCKKSTLKYKEKLEDNILELIDEFNRYFNKDLDNIFDVSFIFRKFKMLKNIW